MEAENRGVVETQLTVYDLPFPTGGPNTAFVFMCSTGNQAHTARPLRLR